VRNLLHISGADEVDEDADADFKRHWPTKAALVNRVAGDKKGEQGSDEGIRSVERDGEKNDS
jgi:hypothetical protein